jgi:Flp pilus assembly protein TadD
MGLLQARLGQLAQATEHFEKVVALRPDVAAYSHLALAQSAAGQWAAAVTNYQRALTLQPDDPELLNNLAWIRATCPDAASRNGGEAVQLAERACQRKGETEARFWGTLDAAYAEAGRFSEAIATAEKTRTLALAHGETALAEAAAKRLEGYRQAKPFRQ